MAASPGHSQATHRSILCTWAILKTQDFSVPSEPGDTGNCTHNHAHILTGAEKQDFQYRIGHTRTRTRRSLCKNLRYETMLQQIMPLWKISST
ncbi:hypothetical protein AAFF_G00373220 [Aldrovandia affinis]|uniref:Uncharacterized protein n=1 Tax=Aldrovandia affinis TaxID=143900 RepID=A0AAD7WM96_9TELE|nr:hypothetical protein AAFF_G00373220 [Aldrovandia affinis]